MILFPDLVLPISSLEVPNISQNSTPISIIPDNIQSTDSLIDDSSSSVPDISDMAQQADSLVHGPSTLIPSNKDPIRKSSRIIKPPSFLRDFHCNLLSQNALNHCDKFYPISDYLSYDCVSPSHKNFVMNVSSQFEPQFYHQAIQFSQWRTAMKEEIDAMESNNTWTIVPLPEGKHSIGCKWIYKIKYRSDGSIERYKARLVAKGYTQQKGLDFMETYSPVAKLVTVKVLLAQQKGLDCHFVHEKIEAGFIKLMPVRSQHQLADIFTKALPSSILKPLLSKMAVKDIYSSS